MTSSCFSLSANSARPPFSKLSMESWRCFACLRMTWTASASLSSASAPDFAIAAYLNADFNMRNTPSLVASLARIASFRSESTRSCKVMRAQLRRRNAIVDVVARVREPSISILSNQESDDPQGLGALLNRVGVPNGDDLDPPFCAFQQARKHVPRAELNENIAAKVYEALYTIGPSHGSGHLIAKRLPDFVRRFYFFTSDVADHWEARRLNRHADQRFFQLFVRAFHQARMIC